MLNRRRTEALEVENEHLVRKVEELTKLALTRTHSPKKEGKDDTNAKRFESIKRALEISQQRFGAPKKGNYKLSSCYKLICFLKGKV